MANSKQCDRCEHETEALNCKVKFDNKHMADELLCENCRTLLRINNFFVEPIYDKNEVNPC